jgi:hypothetical protein
VSRNYYSMSSSSSGSVFRSNLKHVSLLVTWADTLLLLNEALSVTSCQLENYDLVVASLTTHRYIIF